MTTSERPGPGAGGAPSRAAPTPPSTIHALTGVRALAALWVVLCHLSGPPFEVLRAPSALEPVIAYGYLGVDVFFVLSGFIISHNYADRLAARSARRYRSFMLARLARTYPVHLATLLITAGIVLFSSLWIPMIPGQQYTAAGFLGNALMLQAVPGIEAWNYPAWSVSCELAAYLVFPLAAGVVTRLRPGRAAILALIVMVVLALGLIVAVASPLAPLALMWGRIAGEFALGCLLWAAWRRGVRGGRHGDWGAVMALTAVWLVVSAGPSLALSFAAVPFLALFVVAAATARGPVRAVLASRVLTWGGRVSYSLYLVHLPVLMVAFSLLGADTVAALSPASRAAAAVGFLLAAWGTADVLHRWVEEPARRALRRLEPAQRRNGTAVRAGWADEAGPGPRRRKDRTMTEVSGTSATGRADGATP